jgi:hypothetical protein
MVVEAETGRRAARDVPRGVIGCVVGADPSPSHCFADASPWAPPSPARGEGIRALAGVVGALPMTISYLKGDDLD